MIKLIENKPKEITYKVKSDLTKVLVLTMMPEEFWTAFSAFKNHEEDEDEDSNKNYKANITKFYKLIEKTQGVHMFTEKVKRYGYGRIYADAPQSVLTLPRLLANYVSGQFYNDIDIVNAHPTILNQIALKLKESNHLANICDSLNEYVNNRDECFVKYGFSKRDLMKVMYFEGYKGPEFLEKINKFLIYDLYNAFSAMYPKIMEKMIKLKTEKNLKSNKPENYNIRGSVLSMLVQTYEREIAYVMDRYFVENGFKDRCMVYDGFYIEKSFEDKEGLEKFIFENTGFQLKVAYKPTSNDELNGLIDRFYDSTDQKSETGSVDVFDDYTVAEAIIQEHKDEIFKFENELWVYYNYSWTKDIDLVFELWIQQCLIDIGEPKKPKIVRAQTQKFKNYKTQMKNQCLLKYPNDPEQGNSLNALKDILPFEDGFYDFKKRAFFKYEDYPGKVYFTYKIAQKIITEEFPDSARQDLRKIILDIFDSEDLMKEVLQFFCRALSNHYEDKVFTVFVGERNSGKGVLNDILQASFGKAVGSFSFDEFVVRKNMESVERRKGFLSTFTHCSLAISQEIGSNVVVDSTLIKTAVSGGDQVVCRKAFEKLEDGARIRALMAIFGQSIPQFSDNDAMDTMLLINMPCKFEDHVSEEKFGFISKKADPEVKNRLKTSTMHHRLFIELVFSHYSETKPEYKILRAATQENKEQTLEEANPYLAMKKLIFDNYEFTSNPSDRVLTCELISMVRRADSPQLKVMTSQKITNFLGTLNIKKTKSNGKTLYSNLKKLKKSGFVSEED